MRSFAGLAPFVLLAACIALAPAFAQVGEPPLRFGAEVEVVNLSLSVTNSLGQYVAGLGQKDFAVFEDGIRQEISLFGDRDLPISLVLMLDASSSMASTLKEGDVTSTKLAHAKTAAARFLQVLKPGDVAQVMQFNDRTSTLQDFTSDRKALEAALDQAEASGPTYLHNAVYVALKELAAEKKRAGRAFRRRAIVLLSDGEDTGSLVSDEQALDLARRTEINIYPIMFRPHRVSDSNRPEFSQADYLLQTLARATGGQSYAPTALSELDTIYGRIAEELRSLVSIGYVSSNPRRDGKWRRIVVRVPGHDDYMVRHRLGYFAAR